MKIEVGTLVRITDRKSLENGKSGVVISKDKSLLLVRLASGRHVCAFTSKVEIA